MQTSAAIAAAAVAKERNPTAKLLIDWDNDGFPTTTTYVGGFSDLYTDTYTDSYGVPTGSYVTTTSYGTDDVSDRVESMTITRQLATDLPDEVQGMTGYSVAQLDVTLSGNPVTESDNGASFFSPFNTGSPLYGKRRRWRTVQAQIGFGSALLTKFTGKSTSLQVDSASRTATLQALDNAETMRGAVNFPVVVGDDKANVRPGLNSSWIVDYIARNRGYRMSPPPRSGCVALGTLAGSATPEIGTIIEAVGSGPNNQITFGAGKFIQGMTLPGSVVYGTSGSLSTNDGGEVLLEGWVYMPSTGSGPLSAATSDYTSLNPNRVVLSISPTGQRLATAIGRTPGGTLITYLSSLVVPTGTWTYVATHVYFTSATITIHWRVGGSSDSTSVSTSSVTAQPALSQMTVGFETTGAPISTTFTLEAWQAGNPGTTTSAPTWNDAYAGNSTVQPSLNVLSAAVPSTDSAWDVIQQLAAAEFATTGFDETGRFFFYNRSRWTSPPYTTAQRTISAADSLTAIQTSETIDQVRNHVRLTATPAALNKAGWVWNAADIISVPASGSTTVTADMGGPVYGLSTSIRYASSSGMSGQSQYRANRNRDGSGTAVSNLTFTVTVTAGQLASIQINNPNAFAVFLVSGGGFTDPAGTPSLALWGQQVLFAQSAQPDTTSATVTIPAQVVADVSDAISIGQHGDQLLELSGNPWLQDGTSLTVLASDLLARLKDPLPSLDGLTIVGDPRLQLGDRVTIVDPTLGLNGDFFITGITEPFDGSGYTQSLTVRAIT